MKLSVLAVTALVLVSGCDKLTEKLGQKAGEKAVETAAGGDVKVTTGDNGTVTVVDKKTGTVVQGGTGAVKLPAGWPSNVPIYPGATVRNAVTSTNGKNATIATKDPPAKVSDFYKKCGLALQTDLDMGGQHMLVFKNGKGTVNVMVSESGGETMASIAVVD